MVTHAKLKLNQLSCAKGYFGLKTKLVGITGLKSSECYSWPTHHPSCLRLYYILWLYKEYMYVAICQSNWIWVDRCLMN